MEQILSVGHIYWRSIGPLVLISLAIMGSPGPATISLVAVGSAYEVRGGIRYLIGIIAGTVAVLLLVATGVTTLLLAVPTFAAFVTAAAVVYIVRLAYSVATAPPLLDEKAVGARPSFTGGLLLGIANPKAWIAIAAVFASTRLADESVPDAVAKVVVLTVMIGVICVVWLALGASFTPLLRDPRRARIVNVSMAVALLAATALALWH
jgi:threonine/homoserine/homoserine lactone efflux protein